MLARIGIVMASAFTLAACASDSFYRPAQGPGDIGFVEQRTDPARYIVTFQGKDSMEPPTVYEYALLRAAEVTLDAGYGWFYIVSRDHGPRDGVPPDGYPASRYGEYGRYYDRGTATISLEIVMGYGRRPPQDPNAYDARSLRNDLDYLK
jgi:hypothetical protein